VTLLGGLCKSQRGLYERGRDDKSIQRFALFQTSTAKKMISVLFWDITQHKVVFSYRRSGTMFRSHLQWSRSLLLTLGPTGCSETTVCNYHPTLRNEAEEQRPHTEICWENLKVRDHLKKTRRRWQFNKMNRTVADRPIRALFLKAVKVQKHINP